MELPLRGGFPEPGLRLAASPRRRWLDSYVEHLLMRDAELVDAAPTGARARHVSVLRDR